MGPFGRLVTRLTPYQRFSLLVAASFVVGSITLSFVIATVIERFVADETASQTAREIEDHYRVIFGTSVFEGPLSPQDQIVFGRTVEFHLSVYDIFHVRMYRPDGTIVYSYIPAEVEGSALDLSEADRTARALAGDASYVMVSGAALAGEVPGAPETVMRLWAPVHRADGIVGVTEAFRDVDGLVEQVRRMQLILTAVVVLGSLILFLSLGRIYADSTRRLREQEESERAARARVAAVTELARLKDEFVSQVSHELRTPLSPIVGYAELLASRPESPETVQKYAQVIGRQAAQLERLVEDLLELARLGAGRFRLETEPVNLPELLGSAVEQARSSSNRHYLLLDAEPGLPAVQADPGRMRQVIANLLTNAIRYSPGGGPIRIEARRVGEEVEIAFHDPGIGVSPDDLERIFEKFYRVENEQTRGVGGTGLGLAISRELIEAHQGRIWAESRVGAGSVFRVRLPIEQHPAARRDPSSADQSRAGVA